MKKLYIFVCLALCSIAVQSCNNWLDIQPTDRQTEAQTYSSKGGFYRAINGIYSKLNTPDLYGGHLTFNMIEILAKRYTILNSGNEVGTAFQSYRYKDEKVTPIIEKIWETSYEIILNCNIVLDNVERQRAMLGEKDYSIIKGEMLALRAFIHFDMLRLFGPIYKKDPDALSIPYNTFRDGTTVPVVSAKQIINDYLLVDIKNAIALLEKYDPVIKEGPLVEEVEDELLIYSEENLYRYRQLRFNYYALLTLKARIELYAGDNESALKTAKSVITSETIKAQFPAINSLSITSNTNPDRMLTSEAFFGMYNKDRNLINKDYFDPETAGNKLLQPRKTYIDGILFANMSADYRLKGQWIVPTTASNTNKTLGKYKSIQNNLLFYATFVPLIRLSELYLIAAEAEPNFTDGLVHLNYLRVEMRGNIASPITSVKSEADLHTEIMKEYTREFYGEGQLFYYYKRRNISIPGSNNGQNNTTINLTATQLVLPRPESETSPR